MIGGCECNVVRKEGMEDATNIPFWRFAQFSLFENLCLICHLLLNSAHKIKTHTQFGLESMLKYRKRKEE